MPCLQNVKLTGILLLALALTCSAQSFNEGRRLLAEGQYPEARRVLTAVLHEAETTQPGSRNLAIILDSLGTLENESGHFAAAERDFNRARAILESNVNDVKNESVMASVTVHLAEVYLAEQRMADAERLIRHSIAMLQTSGSSDGTILPLAEIDLAVISSKHKPGEAESLLRQAQSQLEEAVGPDGLMMVSSLEPLARLLVSEHRYREALPPAERAWRILESKPHSSATDRATALYVLGDVYAHTGRIPEAEHCAEQAVSLGEEVWGPDHPWLAMYLKSYAAILRQAGQKKEAKAAEERAGQILTRSTHNGAGYTVSADALR